jgi:hypothetical protein
MIYAPDDKRIPTVRTPLEVWYSKRTLEILFSFSPLTAGVRFYWFIESLGVALQGLATGTGGGTSPVTHFRARHGFENRTR